MGGTRILRDRSKQRRQRIALRGGGHPFFVQHRDERHQRHDKTQHGKGWTKDHPKTRPSAAKGAWHGPVHALTGILLQPGEDFGAQISRSLGLLCAKAQTFPYLPKIADLFPAGGTLIQVPADLFLLALRQTIHSEVHQRLASGAGLQPQFFHQPMHHDVKPGVWDKASSGSRKTSANFCTASRRRVFTVPTGSWRIWAISSRVCPPK